MGQRHSNQRTGAVASTSDVGVLAATSVTIAASNPYRQKVEFWVTGATSAVIAYGVTATSTVNSIAIASSGAAPYLESYYTGAINAAIPSAAASTSIRVREISS